MFYFLSPNGNYFETDVEPKEHHKKRWPKGTIQVPKRPSLIHDWDGKAWIENEEKRAEEEAEQAATLTPTANPLSKRQFDQLLIELKIIDRVEDFIQRVRQQDEAMALAIRDMNNPLSGQWNWAMFWPQFQSLLKHPEAVSLTVDIDLSEETVKAAWLKVAGVRF